MADAPFMYWVGMNTPPDRTAAELADFNDFYTKTHTPEVVRAYKGFIRGSRYELAEQDVRGDFGPRWLAIYEMDSQAAADGYIARNDGPDRPKYTPVPPSWRNIDLRWRLIWQRIAPREGGIDSDAPYLYFVGMNVPPDTDEKGLAEFNEFYTYVHVPEVVAASSFLSGARYELYRGFAHPEPGAPRFLAVYEADERSLEARKQRAANPGAAPALSSGPPAWEAHDTLWRLFYRRISTFTADTSVK